MSTRAGEPRALETSNDSVTTADAGPEVLLNLGRRQRLLVDRDELEHAFPEAIVRGLVADDEQLVVRSSRASAGAVSCADTTPFT